MNEILTEVTNYIFGVIVSILEYIINYLVSLASSISIIPTQLFHCIILSLIWLYTPDKIQLLIRSYIARFIGFLAILLYKIMSKPIMRVRHQIQELFGEKTVKIVDIFLKIYNGYDSFESMINHRIYKYIYLGGRLNNLGNYTLIETNGKYRYIQKPTKKSSPFADDIIIIYKRNGMKYDITPYDEIPSDLPDGHYELVRKIGSSYKVCGEYDNPNQIPKITRKF